jgi:SNF2 family DNA or RNA helicase
VGTGKTFIVCEVIRRFWKNKQNNILLLVKAANLEDPWKEILELFGIPFCVIHGPERKDDYLFDDKYPTGYQVILTSYDTWLGDSEYYDVQIGYDLIVFDELHTIINPKKITKKTIGFSKIKAKHRLAITATPVQNTDVDVKFIDLFLNNPTFFDSLEYSKNVTKNKAFADAGNEVNRRALIILPDKFEERKFTVKKVILSVPLSSKMTEYISGHEDIFNNAHSLFSFLSSPETLYYHNSSEKPDMPCAKADAVNMIVDSTPKDDKIIIFSRFIDVLNSYYEQLKKRGYHSLIITGKDRGGTEKKLFQFKTNKTFKILLTTPFKSAEGLNLVSANHIIILEFWWNPHRILQAMGRIDRRTQMKDCFIYLLCYNENGSMYPVEAKYLDVMKKKIDYARSLIPIQERLPEIMDFVNENTFTTEFSDFLMKFMQVKENKLEEVNATPVNRQHEESYCTNEEKQREMERINEECINEFIKEKMPEQNFDDIDFVL